jgi:hypothetical protein
MTSLRYGMAVVAVSPFLLVAGGCSTASAPAFQDRAFLATPLDSPNLPNQPSDNLLPLSPGNRWELRSVSEGRVSSDVLTAIGTATPPGGEPSVEVAAVRNGKPWRREFYQANQTSLRLAAMQDETSPLMVAHPPIPLLRYPFREGDVVDWHGTLQVGKQVFPATAYSRASSMESVATPAGRFQRACRIDTIVVLNANGNDIRFPAVRWFAPGVGFVRRSFADKGRPASSELVRFNVR